MKTYEIKTWDKTYQVQLPDDYEVQNLYGETPGVSISRRTGKYDTENVALFFDVRSCIELGNNEFTVTVVDETDKVAF